MSDCDDCEALRDRVDELEVELQQLREIIELRGADGPADASVSDIWIAGFPLGKTVDKTVTRASENTSRIEKLEDDGADNGVSSVADTDVRATLLPLHLMWIDVREGRADQLSSNERRAARLFCRFIQKGCGEHDTGVTVGHGTYVLTSDRAKDILEAEDELPTSGKAKTIKRVYQRAQSTTKREDCDCDGLESCHHGLLSAEKNNGEWRLCASKGGLREYLRTVSTALEGDAPAAADDDGSEPSEAPPGQPDEINERMDELDAATPAADGGSADTVVSSSHESVSAATDHPEDDT